ncbi:TNF receptor-associated factor homolog 1a-like [Helianthus annuus]|nr:TNF receptor-associated factor homolog 1a-like [Helianthus annuus]
MELSRLSDGYADYDTLVIKAQVQVISFCRFWSGIDQKSRDNMSREKSDSILPKVVKHFFIEKEVTSTLMMESLCMGLTALKEPSMPIVRMEEGSFVLVDDLLLLLEREAIEPLTPKDGYSGEFSIENVEKCLTKLGRRTIEIYVLAHILSKTEVAYQETVPYALNLQEEVIQEQD